jgi:hypothetical protein
VNVLSANGWLEAQSCSSQGSSKFISEKEIRMGKLAKNRKAQSRRVIVLMNLVGCQFELEDGC